VQQNSVKTLHSNSNVLLFFDPGTQRMKKLRYAIQKKTKIKLE